MRSKTRIPVFLTLLVLVLVPSVRATDQVVSDCGDNGGANQLRAKLNAAQSSGGGTISFTCGPSVPVLQGSLPPITTNITINGGGVITINGNLAFRIFRVTSTGSLTLNSITLDSGISTGSDSPPGGGAINSDGTLSLNNVTLQNNQATAGVGGGAIFANGMVSIANSTFSKNYADYAGGAIGTGANSSTTTVTITSSIFSGNKATSTNLNTGLGGAIFMNQNGGTLTATDSAFNSNQAQFGGAIYVSQGATGTLRTQNTASPTYFLTNYASDSGGAVMNRGTLNIDKVDFNTNSAQNVAASGYGGAIADTGSVTITDSSFSTNSGRFGGAILVGETFNAADTAIATLNRTNFYGNTAAVFGGAIYSNLNTAQVHVNNSSFDQNSAASGGAIRRFNARVDIANSSFTYNNATGDGGGLSIGFGGFGTDPTFVSVTNTTFSANTSGNGQGGGISNSGYAVFNSLTLKDNTNGIFIAAGAITTHLGNSALDNPVNCAGSGPAIVQDSSSLSTDNTCAVSIQNTPAKLGALTTNTNGVNHTKYHPPLPGSPLIDAGQTNGAPTTDQRGVPRPQGPAVDLGAVERAATLGNISTRGFVGTGDNVLIGGLIISGTGPKQVLLRALGPTIGRPPFNVGNALADPVLELHMPGGNIVTNDNWMMATNAAAISSTSLAPPDPAEAAILMSLDPGNYTAIVRGANNVTGVALVEAYDLDPNAPSKFGNISTRGFVQTGDNLMIAGVIVNGPDNQDVIIRGLGPTLGQPPFSVPNSLADPFLDLRNAHGDPVVTNDNWQDSQASQIQATGYAPPNTTEAAILINLSPGNYTAILSGVNNSTGNALVEVYALN